MANYMVPRGETVQETLPDMAEDMAYLSNKRVLLSNPGTRIHQAYYSAINSTVDAVEMTYNTGRLTISLSQLAFRGQAQIIIPNSSFLEEFYLHLVLPPLTANQTICRGWGWASIAQISYLFGSSNVSQLSVSGQSMWQHIASSCETSEKRNMMWKLGGDEILGGPGPSGPNIDANIIIPLPWSNATGAGGAKLPYDTTLLSNPITVQIQFNGPESIYGGSDPYPSPASFLSGTAIMRQGDLGQKNNSLKFLMMREPSLMYAYPFVHTQSFTPSNFTVSGTTTTINLIGFIAADLLAITFGVVANSDLANGGPPNFSSPNPFNYQDLRDIMLTFNGLVMYNAPGSSYKLFNMQSMVGSGEFQGSIIQPAAGGVPPYTSTPIDTNLVVMNFARLRQVTFEGQYQNVWQIGNNVLNLQFGNLTIGTGYTLFATFYYNAVNETQNGQSTIYFN